MSIEWKIGNNLPRIQADHYSLLQVSLNLARNSARAIAATETKRLEVETGTENDMVVVRFRDTGPGIGNPDNLFKPFQPGAHSAGLGLYVSRAILRTYWGEPHSEGSCFVVQLWPAEDLGGIWNGARGS